MPTLRSGNATTPEAPAVSNAPAVAAPTLLDLVPVVDRESAAEPAPEGEEWTIAFVRFKVPEFGKSHDRTVTWTWWIRFRTPIEWKTQKLQARAKKIVRAMYSPPAAHQRTCDFCTSPDGQTYNIADDDFKIIEIMPCNMHTSDDDYDAHVSPKLLIKACTIMKAARDAKKTKIQKLKERQAAELAALEAER